MRERESIMYIFQEMNGLILAPKHMYVYSVSRM